MRWGTALRTAPPHPVMTLFSRQQKHSKTPAVSASTRRQHLSLIGHFCSLSSQRRSLCSCSFVHWLPHYSCNPCSTRSLARHSVWHTESACRSIPGVWLVRRGNANRQEEEAMGQRRLNCRSLSINPRPLLPPPNPRGSGMTFSPTHFERKIQLGLGFRVRLLPLRGVKHHSRWIKPAKQHCFTWHIFFSNSPLLCTLSSPLEKDKRQYVRYWARNELILSKWCSPGSLYVFFRPSCRLNFISYFQMFSLCDSYLYLLPFKKEKLFSQQTIHCVKLCSALIHGTYRWTEQKGDVTSGNVSAAKSLLSLVGVTHIKRWPSQHLRDYMCS